MKSNSFSKYLGITGFKKNCHASRSGRLFHFVTSRNLMFQGPATQQAEFIWSPPCSSVEGLSFL